MRRHVGRIRLLRKGDRHIAASRCRRERDAAWRHVQHRSKAVTHGVNLSLRRTGAGRGRGAAGALAQGIGTSEVEHVMATQCLVQNKAKNFAINVSGSLAPGVTAKDLVLAIIGRLGTAGATGHTIEYRGTAIRELSMEARMI